MSHLYLVKKILQLEGVTAVYYTRTPQSSTCGGSFYSLVTDAQRVLSVTQIVHRKTFFNGSVCQAVCLQYKRQQTLYYVIRLHGKKAWHSFDANTLMHSGC